MKRQLSALAFCAGLVLTDRLIAAWPNAETGLIAVSCALVLAGIAGLTRGGNPSGSLLAYLATAVVVIRLDKFFVSLSWLLPAGRGTPRQSVS